MSLMPIKWSNEQIFQLLEMFKNRKLLWDTGLDEYRDRNKKHGAWMEMANAFGMERQDVEKKVKSLIGQFQRELRKCKYENGSDRVSKWFAYKKMMFLRERSKSDNSRGASVQDEPDNEKEKESETEREANTFAAPRNRTHRKRALPQEDEPSQEELSILKRMCRSAKPRDEFDVFGEHVAMKLRHLNSSYAKHTAQFQINNILYHAAMGEYNWTSMNGPPSVPPSNLNCFHTSRSGLSETSANTPGRSSVLSVDESSQSLDDMLNSEDIKPDIKDFN